MSLGGADPVERKRALEPGVEDRAHLALLGRVVDDARVMAGLGREHERRHDAARVEVEKSRSRASGASNTISCGVVQEGACRVARGEHPAREVKRHGPALERGGPALAEAFESGGGSLEPAVEESRAEARGGDRGTLRDSAHLRPPWRKAQST